MDIGDAEKDKKELKNKLEETLDLQMRMLEEFEDKSTEVDPIDKHQLNSRSTEYDLAMKKIQLWFNVQTRKLGIKEEIQGFSNEVIFQKICQKIKE